ncbi:MAG: tetratricopeptide repeat protein, partial [Myxococcota bacterium]
TQASALLRLRRVEDGLAAAEDALELAPEDPRALLLLASAYVQVGDRAAAEPLYRRYRDALGGMGGAVALARFLQADRETDAEAASLLGEAIEQATAEECPVAHQLLAGHHSQRGAFGPAEAALRQGIERCEVDLSLLADLAALFRLQGDPEAADAVLESEARSRKDVASYLALAGHRRIEGDLPGALEATAAALELEPKNPKARLQRGELLLEIGFATDDRARVAAGSALVKAVLADAPRDPEALFADAKVRLVSEDFEGATDSLRQAIDLRPGWPEAHLLLGSVLLLAGDVDWARLEAARAAELAPDLLAFGQLRARVHVRAGEPRLALQFARSVLERSEDPEMRGIVVASLLALGRPDEARAAIEWVPFEARTSGLHSTLGRLEMARGDLAGARRSFEAAAALQPDRVEPLEFLLQLDLREGRVEESAKRIRAASDARPDDAELARLSGLVALQEGRGAEAEADLRRAIELDPNYLAAYTALVSHLAASGRFAEVLPTYEAALEANPQSVSLRVLVGSMYGALDRRSEAIAQYEAAIEIDPDLGTAKNNLAYALAEEGSDLDRALALAQDAKAQLPDHPLVADTLGWVLYRKGIASAALPYLTEAERGLPPDQLVTGEVLHHLALAYEAAGEAGEARAAAERALALLERANVVAGAEPAWAADVRALQERLAGADTAGS